MDTKQMDIKIEGLGTITQGSYGRIRVEGVGKIRGDVEFDSMRIDGTCNAEGTLIGKHMDVEGILKVNGDVKVKELEVEGMMKTADHKIYADKIRVEGMLKNEGEVNADNVLIEGCVNINDLFGDEIEINYDCHGHVFFFGKKNMFSKINKAGNIECSKLKACNLTCKTICATDIVLTDYCVVDTVNCNGSLKYDSTCKIRHIEGDCIKSSK